ncbi:MAG: hypothetical protein LBR16_01250 [Treponema sp.]|jgi:hypothetical protein|nr:hypothetical protein [Treponema sp.]
MKTRFFIAAALLAASLAAYPVFAQESAGARAAADSKAPEAAAKAPEAAKTPEAEAKKNFKSEQLEAGYGTAFIMPAPRFYTDGESYPSMGINLNYTHHFNKIVGIGVFSTGVFTLTSDARIAVYGDLAVGAVFTVGKVGDPFQFPLGIGMYLGGVVQREGYGETAAGNIGVFANAGMEYHFSTLTYAFLRLQANYGFYPYEGKAGDLVISPALGVGFAFDGAQPKAKAPAKAATPPANRPAAPANRTPAPANRPSTNTNTRTR